MVEWIDDKWIESLVYAPHQCYKRFKDSKGRLYTAYLRWRYDNPWQFRIAYGDAMGSSDDFEFITTDLFDEYDIFLKEEQLKLAERTAEAFVEELFSMFGDLIDIVEKCKEKLRKKLNGLNPKNIRFEISSIKNIDLKIVRGIVDVTLPNNKYVTANTIIELEETPITRLKKIIETKFGDKVYVNPGNSIITITIKSRHIDEFIHYIKEINEYIESGNILENGPMVFYIMNEENKKENILKAVINNQLLTRVRVRLKNELGEDVPF